jgi:hypothetical protein
MVSFEKEREKICDMLTANGYKIRDNPIQGDDFRIFLVPPGMEIESEEIFKIKNSGKVCCGSEVIMGGKIRDVFFKQKDAEQEKFKKILGSATGVEDLDVFEMVDDGKDFRITVRTEFQISELSEDVFGDAMDRLNIAGGSIEDAWNKYFDDHFE